MLGEFDELVRARKELKDWWNLRVTTAAYDGSFHRLIVQVQKPAMVSFYGQQYAGAKNYHDAPGFFIESVRAEMQAEANKIVANAYETELKRLDAQIEAHRAAVLEQLSAE